MIDMNIQCQSVIFGNFSDITPSHDVLSKMLKLFHDKNLLPSTFREISALTLGSGNDLRLRLSTPNDEWQIGFGTNRISIDKNMNDPKGSNLGDIKGFIEESQELANRILSEFKKRCNRISLITGGLMKEMTDENFNKIYNSLFKTVDYYKENAPFEWNWRSAARKELNIAGSVELINVITALKRVKGSIVQQDFERIGIDFDINTIGENKDTRFDIDSIRSFYPSAIEIREKILSELEGVLNV